MRSVERERLADGDGRAGERWHVSASELARNAAPARRLRDWRAGDNGLLDAAVTGEGDVHLAASRRPARLLARLQQSSDAAEGRGCCATVEWHAGGRLAALRGVRDGGDDEHCDECRNPHGSSMKWWSHATPPLLEPAS